jgi:hypothetical protein
LPPEVRESLVEKLEDLKKQQDAHARLAVERKIFFRNRKIKFFGKKSFYLAFSQELIRNGA